jgi:hypothetical protein
VGKLYFSKKKKGKNKNYLLNNHLKIIVNNFFINKKIKIKIYRKIKKKKINF